MKYHEKIAEYRLKHKREPLAIFIDDYEYDKAKARWIDDLLDPSCLPHVTIAGDFIPGLDLRFVFGLKVHGSSRDERRAKALFRRLQVFKPAMCAVTLIDKQNFGHSWMGVYTSEQGVIYE